MKKNLLLITSLLIITLIPACSGGYYSHVPRAKTQKTTTVKVKETRQTTVYNSNAVNEADTLLADVMNESGVISSSPIKEVFKGNISRKSLKQVAEKSTETLNFYSSPKKAFNKYSPNTNSNEPSPILIVLVVILALVGLLVLLSVEGGCGCIILILALVGLIALIVGVS